MNEFPTLSALGLPVKYNYAGVPYVPWDDVIRAVRPRGWEQEFASKFGSRGGLQEGPFAHDLDEVLELFLERG